MFKEIEIPRWKVDEHLAKSKLKKIFFDAKSTIAN